MSWTTLINSQTLAAHLHDPNWVICDCRFALDDPEAGLRAYRQSHLPGARYLHLDRDLSGPRRPDSGRHPLPEPEVLARRLGELGIGGNTQVVAYDHAGGVIAARLWWLLRWLGHEAVAVLDGGWQRWLQQGGAVSTALPVPEPQVFEARPRRAAWLSSEQVVQMLAEGSSRLIDARNGPRFRGEQEPMDPVAGHIPGALNRPCTDNLDAQGCMRPAAELRAAFQSLSQDAEAVVHTCGSGVTACHNQLAMEVAGLSGSRLYVGSWSEWIRDPKRPRATGAA